MRCGCHLGATEARHDGCHLVVNQYVYHSSGRFSPFAGGTDGSTWPWRPRCMLHGFKAETDMRKEINEFYNSKPPGQVLNIRTKPARKQKKMAFTILLNSDSVGLTDAPTNWEARSIST